MFLVIVLFVLFVLAIVFLVLPVGFHDTNTSRQGLDPSDYTNPPRLTFAAWLDNTKTLWQIIRPIQTINEWRYGDLSLGDMLFDLLLTLFFVCLIMALPLFLLWEIFHVWP